MKQGTETVIRAQAKPWNRAIELLVFVRDFTNQRQLRGTLAMEPMPEGQFTEPTLSIDTETAQTLMDDLWNCGLRPTDGSGSAGSLLATEKHLKDMRAIAFQSLKMTPSE